MTKYQIKMLRDFYTKVENGKRLAGSLAVICNNEVAFVDSKDHMVYDDTNEFVHTIRINNATPDEQVMWPFRITSTMYDVVQYMEALLDMQGLEKAIDGLFVSKGLMSADAKAAVMQWANSIRNHSMVPKQPGPYFKTNAVLPGNTYTPEIRPDGIWHSTSNDTFITETIALSNQVTNAIYAVNGFEEVLNGHYLVRDVDTLVNAMGTFKALGDTVIVSDGKHNITYSGNKTTITTLGLREMLTQKDSFTVVMYVEKNNTRISIVFSNDSELIGSISSPAPKPKEDESYEYTPPKKPEPEEPDPEEPDPEEPNPDNPDNPGPDNPNPNPGDNTDPSNPDIGEGEDEF